MFGELISFELIVPLELYPVLDYRPDGNIRKPISMGKTLNGYRYEPGSSSKNCSSGRKMVSHCDDAETGHSAKRLSRCVCILVDNSMT